MNLLPAILAFLLLPHGRAYVRECRRMPQGCENYAAELAHAIDGASAAHGVDPRLLVALAYHESSLTGRSNAVSRGVFGWHRRSAMWSRCSTADMECQADLTAAHLRDLLFRCGSWAGALSAYQSGQCKSDSGVRYARRVLGIGGAI